MKNWGIGALPVAAFAAVFGGRFALFAFVLIVAVAAGGELFRLERLQGARPGTLLGLAAIVALLVVAYVRGERAVSAFPAVIAAAVGAAFVMMLLRRDRTDVTRGIALTVLPVLTVGLLGAYVVAMRRADDGFRLVLVLFAMAAAADAASGVAGGRGEHSRRPPAWYGTLAAFVATAAVAVVAAIALDPPFTWARAIVLGLVVAAASRAADTIATMLEDALVRVEPGIRRRRADLFRRVDGVLVSAPFFFYAFRVLAR